MGKKRVPLHQNPRGFVDVDPDATPGAQVGVNLLGPDGRVLSAAQVINPVDPGSSGGPNGISSTLWKLIREIPLNIQKLAALVGRGFAVRRDDGEWALRTLQDGDGIDITNPDGEAGDPEISLEDLPDSGVGAALVKITRDAKGRVSGTAAATTDDLPQGAVNKYFPEAPIDGGTYGRKDGGWAIPVHNGLSALQGGTPSEYYHATAAQNAALAALALSGYIDGLQLVWTSVNSVSFTSGTAAIPSLGALLRFPSAITKSGLSLAASTFYHAYGFSNSGTPDVEITTTAPSSPYLGAARTKTGDTSRRYLGSFLTDTSGFIHQFIQSGNLVLYPRAGAGGGSVFRVLSAKITAAEQAVSLSGVIPGTASGVFARFFFNRSVGDNAMNFAPISGLPKMSNVTSPGVAFFTVPLTTAQTLYIQLNNDVTDGNGAAYIDVNGFTYER
ncbi:hypothetical protein V8017_15995 [Stenotrophomonas rhizophila]